MRKMAQAATTVLINSNKIRCCYLYAWRGVKTRSRMGEQI